MTRPRVVRLQPRPRWGRRNAPLVIAHRGASAERPENSAAAFARARELRADGVELDVMRCGTGELVVFHDDDLARLGGRPERVRESPLALLREVDLGGGESIPTLDEALEAIGPELLVNIEMKAPERKGLEYARAIVDDGLPHAVAAAVLRHGLLGRALVSSFDPVLLARLRRIAPEIATGLLFHSAMARPLRHAWAAALLRPTALHPEGKMVDARALAHWRRRGHAVNVWTIDDPREVACLAALGVDGVITNRPEVARRAIESTISI